MTASALLQDKIEGSALIASMERASTRRELIDAANGTRHCIECARLHEKNRGPRGSDYWNKINAKRSGTSGQ